MKLEDYLPSLHAFLFTCWSYCRKQHITTASGLPYLPLPPRFFSFGEVA